MARSFFDRGGVMKKRSGFTTKCFDLILNKHGIMEKWDAFTTNAGALIPKPDGLMLNADALMLSADSFIPQWESFFDKNGVLFNKCRKRIA